MFVADPYERRVILRFTAGGAIALLWSAVLLSTLAGLPRAFPTMPRPPMMGLINIIGPLLGFMAGGAVGGSALRLGRRATIGFGIGFLAPGLPSLAAVIITGVAPRRVGIGLLVGLPLSFGVAFGLAAGIGAACASKGLKFVWDAVKGFALGGLLAGTLIAMLVLLRLRDTFGVVGQALVFLTVVLALLGPWFLGGIFLAGAARRSAQKSDAILSKA